MRFIIILLALALPMLASAQLAPVKASFEEGKHYTVIPGSSKPAKTGKITVTEFYWYGCGHCFKFEPMVSKWAAKLPADVEFSASPAMWRDNMRTHAKLYYTAKSLGKLEPLHQAFFDAMNVKRNRLVKPAEISKIVSAHGVDGKVFLETMDSFAVNAQVKLADSRQKNYRISATPELVVGGYYHIRATGGQKQMLDVASYLVEKIRNER